MADKKLVCNHCGIQMFMVPPITHTIRHCPICRTAFDTQTNDDSLSRVYNSIHHMSIESKDLINKVSSNNSNMTSRNNITYSRSVTSPTYGYHPNTTRISPSLVPGSAHGNKRAVLCGVSYYGQKHRLNGTVNDAKCMEYFLSQKAGFPSHSILVLTEGASDPSLIPTKNNMRRAMRWLVQGCKTGDSLVFHYSGHGSQVVDYDGDEVDGYDEVLWPVDHQTEGKIVDDEVNATIVRPLPTGAKLHAIIDSCHSGTILDLPFVCRMNRDGLYRWEDQGHRSIYKGTSGGLAVSFTACDDHDVSWDTTAFSGNAPTGALTFSFIQAAQNEPGLTYGRLLNVMRHKIRETTTGFLPNSPVRSLFTKVVNRPPQEPQLSSSEEFDVNTRKFCL